jgi:hypothetical protein
MFSRLKCIFPVASSPLQKFSCITVGSCITIGSTYFVLDRVNKYISNESIVEKKENKRNYRFSLNTTSSFLLIPIMQSNDPYSFGMSLPLLGLYCVGGYFWSNLWYDNIKRCMMNIKNANQCCKLIRMSMIGTIKHSSFMVLNLCSIGMLGLGFYITTLNGYNIIKYGPST